jgi:tetratricopeptide (TPR) repeat protein
MAARPSDQVGPELCEALLTQFTTQLYKAQRHEETVKVLSSPLARRFALTASLHFALGLACFSLKQYDDAATQMRQCLATRGQPALTPINTSILTTTPHHCLATCLAQVGDFDAAEKAFQAGMNDKGNDEELRLGYAQFLTERGRGVEAVRLLHAFVAENRHSAAAWRLGGKICLGHAEFLEVARDWTGEAFKQLPHDSTILAQHAEALLLTQQTAEARGLWEIIWRQESQPRALAALILCELAEENSSTHAMDHNTDLGLTSRAFIDWYRRCLSMGSHALVKRVNERTEVLQTVLPAAAEMIRAALAEASQNQPGKPDLCPA